MPNYAVAPHDAELVQYVFRLYLEDGLTTDDIAVILADDGITADVFNRPAPRLSAPVRCTWCDRRCEPRAGDDGTVRYECIKGCESLGFEGDVPDGLDEW